MRPQGVIRRALYAAAARLYETEGGATRARIAANTVVPVAPEDSIAGELEQRGVDDRTAKVTIDAMVRAGQLEIIGRDKPAGARQWHAIYAPVQRCGLCAPDRDPTQRLDGMLKEVQAFG